MRKITDYKPLSNDDQTLLLSKCLPRGLAWDAKGDRSSNLYALLKSIATEMNSLEEKIYLMVSQWDINYTDDLISEWETAVGIPDECRDAAEEISIRRSDVINKLKKIPVKTVAEYKALAETITGEDADNWDIRPGAEDYPDDPLYKFVLLITPPIINYGAFGYPLGSGRLSISSLTNSSTTATAVVSDTSTMVDGSTIRIAGADDNLYNGDFILNIIDSTSFSYTFPGGAVSPDIGSPTISFGIDQTQVDSLDSNSQFISPAGKTLEGYPFSGQFRSSVLQCVFRKVTPATVAIVFD